MGYKKIRSTYFVKHLRSATNRYNPHCCSNANYCCNQCSWQGVAGFLYFGYAEVDAHAVEDALSGAEDNGGHEGGGRFGSVCFEDVQEEAAGSAGGEKADHG